MPSPSCGNTSNSEKFFRRLRWKLCARSSAIPRRGRSQTSINGKGKVGKWFTVVRFEEQKVGRSAVKQLSSSPCRGRQTAACTGCQLARRPPQSKYPIAIAKFNDLNPTILQYLHCVIQSLFPGVNTEKGSVRMRYSSLTFSPSKSFLPDFISVCKVHQMRRCILACCGQ